MRKKIVGFVFGIMLFCSGCGRNENEPAGNESGSWSSDEGMTQEAPDAYESMTQEMPDSSDAAVQGVPAASVQQEPYWAQGTQTRGELLQGLNLDGIGDADDEAYVSIYQFGDYEDKVTVLRVHLGTGETMAKVFPVYGFIKFQTGKILSEDKDGIVLEIGDFTSNYNAANLYILDVEPLGLDPVPQLTVRLDTVTLQENHFISDSALNTLMDVIKRGTEIVDMEGKPLQGVKVVTIDPTGLGEDLEYTLYWEDGEWVLSAK